MESLTALKQDCAILSVVGEPLEPHVAEDDGLEPVVELHLPRLEDPDVGRVPRRPHQGRLPPILDKDVRSPNMIRKVILSIDHFETCEI